MEAQISGGGASVRELSDQRDYFIRLCLNVRGTLAQVTPPSSMYIGASPRAADTFEMVMPRTSWKLT